MQPSWEKKSLEEQQRTNELIDEIGYSEGQRKLDEMVFGDEAFVDQDERRPLPGSGVPGLLGSPYRSGYGGQVYVTFYSILGIVVLALLAFGIHTCANLSHSAAQPLNTPPPAAVTAPANPGGP